VSGGRRLSVERESWLRAPAGIAQLTLGTWLAVAWLVQAPTPIRVGRSWRASPLCSPV